MEAKTAAELWNDGVEGRLNLQLYHCDVDSLLQEDRVTYPLRFFELGTPSCEEFFDDILRDTHMTSPFSDLDDQTFGENILEGRVIPPLRSSDHLDSSTYEELFEQNWQLFDGLNQDLERSCTLKDGPYGLSLLDASNCASSDGAVLSNNPVMPERTCLTSFIEAMVMYPPCIEKAPKKRKKTNWAPRKRSRPPRETTIVASDDGNEVDAKIEVPPRGIGKSCQPKQPVTEFVRGGVRKKDAAWESPIGISSSPRDFATPPIPASKVLVPSFAEHLARCAVDWDYPLFSTRGGDQSKPVSQEMTTPLQIREKFARPDSGSSLSTVPARFLAPPALEQNSMTRLDASNCISWNRKRSASSNHSNNSERFHGSQISAGRSVGFENVEPTTKPAPRENKRRRLFT